MIKEIEKILGDETADLLEHRCEKVQASALHHPGPQCIENVLKASDRPLPVIRNMMTLFNSGRLGKTGYLSILPVDHGVEHSAGASFSENPEYFDPKKILDLACTAECSAVATTVGVLGAVAREYIHRIPFIVKINHNELLSYPNTYDQRFFASVRKAFEMGAVGIGATIYFGSPQSRRQIEEVARLFEAAHELGMFCVLWCYIRNSEMSRKDPELAAAVDLSAQANHLGATLEADIVKQKMPSPLHGFEMLQYGKTSPGVYRDLLSEHVIDMVRYQVLNGYAGRCPLVNSGGAASGGNDLADAVRSAVINKRAGGAGIISGRKAFQRPFAEGVALLNAIQNVYLDKEITLA